jgi:hypothetical protein
MKVIGSLPHLMQVATRFHTIFGELKLHHSFGHHRESFYYANGA